MSTFTAHNIRLDDGTLTKPDLGWEMTEHPLLLAVQRLLKSLYPEGVGGKTLVDLGCLEGGYTVEFARMGLSATGIEVRRSNIESCRLVQAAVNLPNLVFAHDDAWNLPQYGRFDITFCCGLLYHLDTPRRFLSLLAETTGRVLILDTHYATEQPTEDFQLGEIVEHEGLRGRWYTEFPDDAEVENEDSKWSSWQNRRSFWPLRSELSRALWDCGFPSAFELLNSGSAVLNKQRITLVGLK